MTARAVFDVAVDIRVGSPTFGQWDAVLLDDRDRRSIYLCSAGYAPDREHTILATDPALGINWPDDHQLHLSDRDAAAPTLAQAHADGLLPTWQDTYTFIDQLRRRT